MKKIKLQLALFLAIFSNISIFAQNDEGYIELPNIYSISFGGGLMVPSVDGNNNDFFNRNGDCVGYCFTGEWRYYLNPNVGVGLQYDYLNAQLSPDKMHVHYVHPNITFRYLMSNDKQGLYLSLGIGYMDYQERIYNTKYVGHKYHKGYCGLSIGLGYEFAIAKGMGGILKMDVLTADWFANPDGRLFNPDKDYDDGINHSWFKNHITFVNFGFMLLFGK